MTFTGTARQRKGCDGRHTAGDSVFIAGLGNDLPKLRFWALRGGEKVASSFGKPARLSGFTKNEILYEPHKETRDYLMKKSMNSARKKYVRRKAAAW
jgi:hypothetical protein